MSVPLRLLVVEDSELAVKALLGELRRGGFEPTHERVDTAEALRAALARHAWDLVISDCTMPSFSGLEALGIVRSWRLDLPFIFVSGTIGEEVAAAAMHAGADDYIPKGDLSRLAPAIKRQMGRDVCRQKHRKAEDALPQNEEQLRPLLDSTKAAIDELDFEGKLTSLDHLRTFAARLQKVREEERATVAREIHDELGQALTAIKMDLTSLFRHLPKDQKPLANRAQSVLEVVDQTIQQVRRIATELRPGILDKFGLTAAIEWAAEEFNNRAGVESHVDLPEEDIILDAERSTAIFRIFQETLTNVARHSNATQVRIHLAKENHNVVLEVHDNGKGIEARDMVSSTALGILGMRERALMLKGQFEISGSAEEGTTVRVRIPTQPHPELR